MIGAADFDLSKLIHTPHSNRIFAVVVTYQPNAVALRSLLAALLQETAGVIVVDNTSEHDHSVEDLLTDALLGNVRLLRMGENRGIATALNVGISKAAELGASHVLLSDQDSLPSPGMVAVLSELTQQLTERGNRVGSVSPEYFDLTTRQTFPFQVQRPGNFFYSSAGGKEATPWVEILTGITSGTLIPCAVLEDVGQMREDFFIDYVDTEWCHRARHKGYSLFGTACTRLNHRLGDDQFLVWAFGWRPYTAYSPVRLYYRFRNFVLLFRLRHVALRWKLRAFWYWLGNAYAYLIFSPRRAENLRMIAKGLRDGLMGRSGRIKQ
jgi:rhamnosyltransferase